MTDERQPSKELATQAPGRVLVPEPGVVNVQRALREIQPALAAALPSHLKSERMIRIAMTAIRKNRALLNCDLRSFVGAILQAAQLGLEPDGVLGEAYLIPFGKECTLIPGYKGLLKLARQSGQISSITARAVHAKDEFVFEFGLQEDLKHVPSREEEPGPLTDVYAIARLKDGGVQVDVMTSADVNRIRDKSQGYQNARRFNKPTPWDEHYDEMAKKTVIRRLCKLLPASVELARAVAIDEAADAGVGQGMADALALEGIEITNGDYPIEGSAPPPEEQGKRMKLTKKPADVPQAAQGQAELPVAAAPERQPGQEG